MERTAVCFMGKIIIEGGRKLFGRVDVAAAKNSCLPIIASAIAVRSEIRLLGAPKITDVCVMAQIIESLGGRYVFDENGLVLYTDSVDSYVCKSEINVKARASFFTAGALLTRFGRAYMPYPGGCSIGARPVDIHIDGLKSLGAEFECDDKGVYFDGRNMHSGNVRLRYPSVGATVNVIGAALGLDGETTICGAACEPEIRDTCNFLRECGYEVRGGGSPVIRIVGRKNLSFRNVVYRPLSDRIEAGTFLFACLACGGEIEVGYDCPENLNAVFEVLRRCGAKTYFFNGKIVISADERPLPVSVCADVFPKFPTDLQPQLCAALTICRGESRIEDKVFPDRFCYADMLEKFGAIIDGRYSAVRVHGVPRLHSAVVEAGDLRGGAALCIAALSADGESIVSGTDKIKRGYHEFCKKIGLLGGTVREA